MISVRLSCVLLSVLPLYSFAIDHDEILQRALTEFDDNYRDNWAFTEEREFGGVTTLARFDPVLQEMAVVICGWRESNVRSYCTVY